MHYSSSHHILLVGDGDFSFSLCLARAFGNASFIVATSLDSYDTLIKKFKQARSNIEKLNLLGATVLHGVDARKMRLQTDLYVRKFDRIIFNFPHAGFCGKEDNIQLIKMHRKIVKGFFRNASGMLRPCGEIHVNHKTTAPFRHWNIEELAKESSLLLIDCVQFKKEDYPGYNNKRGAGPRSDEPFPLGECSTYKFVLRAMTKGINMVQRRPPQALDKNIHATFVPRATEMPFMGYARRNSPQTLCQNVPVTSSPRVTDMSFMEYAQRRPMQALDQNIHVTSLPRVTELDQNIHVTSLSRVTEIPFMGYAQRRPMQALDQNIHVTSLPRVTELDQNIHVTSLPRVTEMPFMGYAQRRPLLAPYQNIHVTSLPRVTRMPFMRYVEIRTSHIEDEIMRIFSEYFNHVITSGRPSYDIYYSTRDHLRIGFERYREESGIDLNGYIRLLHELGLFQVSRMANFDCQLRARRALVDMISSI